MSRLSRRLILLAVAAVAGCADRQPPITGPGEESPAFAELLVSEARAVAAGAVVGVTQGGDAAFLSLPPGSLDQGVSLRVRNLTTSGAAVTIPVIDGGFDPVAVPAREDDQLELALTMQTGAVSVAYARVPGRRPPVIVRTYPTKGRTDVALNVIPTVIFSEPVATRTLEKGVRLLRGGEEVQIEVRPAPGQPWGVQLVPAVALESETSYELRVGMEVEDLDGDALVAGESVVFTTAGAEQPPPPPPVESRPLSDFRLAFTSNRRGTQELFVAHADGSSVTAVTQGRDPTWSPDGARIAFSRGTPGGANTEIWVIGAIGAAPQMVSRGEHPSWSPDGTRLLYVRQDGAGASAIYVAPADGTPSEQLLISLGDDFALDGWPALALKSPTWSPTGEHIALVAWYGWEAPEAIYVVGIDGSSPRRLARVDEGWRWGTSDPAWAPGGSRVAFTTLVCCNQLNGAPEYVIASLDTHAATAQTVHYHSASEAGPSWAGGAEYSPDGLNLGFARSILTPGQCCGGERLFAVDIATGSARQLIPDDPAASPGYSDTALSWSRAPYADLNLQRY